MRAPRVLGTAVATLLVATTAAQAATPEVSTRDRLQDRRVVAAGERAFSVGFADGMFYANGWHITGEMGGFWTPPMKMLDGLWFGVDDDWVGPARRFSTGWGYTRYDLPDTAGLRVRRVDFAPDGAAAVVSRLQLLNGAPRARTVTVRVQAHSELMGSYPWGFSGVTPNASDNLPDHGAFTGSALRFTDTGSLPGAPQHDYAAMVGSDREPSGGEAADTAGTFRGPQGDDVCMDGEQKAPSECDDGPFGKGTGGELRYQVRIPARSFAWVNVAVAGSDRGADAAQAQLDAALENPAQALADKERARRALARRSHVSLPGDRLLQHSIEWGKQNLADLTLRASDLPIRWVNQGKQFPAPLGTVASARWIGAGFPDYPWIFATDAEYTAFAAVALGQFDVIKDNLRTLRDISEVLNGGSGIVTHETVPNGATWFGHDSTTTRDDGTVVEDFNTDETIKFPSTVALVWRWTGDDAFRDEMYDFAKRNLEVVANRLDEDDVLWPEGSGNVERNGMGREKLDNAVYWVRALYDLADMASSKGDTVTADWATTRADDVRARFDAEWFDTDAGLYADSLLEGNERQLQKHWIGSVPMEAELNSGTERTSGLAPFEHGDGALAVRENTCYSGERPGSLGLYHTGCGGGPEGNGEFAIFSLGTGIQAVGEGNYGRLGRTEQQRYTHANAETQFGEPATGGTPDEQPGAMPEIFPSSPGGTYDNGGTPPNIDRCFTCRSMFMQAWGHYGTAWPVIHQHLGVSPFLNHGTVHVVPQVPPGQPSVAGSNIRLGDGSVGVFASHAGRHYTTKVDAKALPVDEVVVGHTLPRDAEVSSVVLDGKVVEAGERLTNRGLEVTVPASKGAVHTLSITTAG